MDLAEAEEEADTEAQTSCPVVERVIVKEKKGNANGKCGFLYNGMLLYQFQWY